MNLVVAMLADAAQVANGKLYVHGGGWDTMFAAQFPVIHPTLAVVTVFRVEYDEALQPINLEIDLIDEDDSPQGFQVAGILEVGHAAGTKRGAPSLFPNQVTVNALRFDSAGMYRFRVRANEKEIGSIQCNVRRMPGAPTT